MINYDDRIAVLQRQILMLQHKDRWSQKDHQANDNMKHELKKLLTLRTLNELESTIK